MPRFSKEEREVLIPAVHAFAEHSPDPKVRAKFKNILMKLRESDKHHAKKETQGGKQ